MAKPSCKNYTTRVRIRGAGGHYPKRAAMTAATKGQICETLCGTGKKCPASVVLCGKLYFVAQEAHVEEKVKRLIYV